MNTGEQVQAHSLKKNEIAYCDITVAEEIPVDTFEKHKTLGEVLFIDRVTNMTSACGRGRSTGTGFFRRSHRTVPE